MTARERPLRLSAELRERVVAEAEARGVEARWLVNQLITEGLDNLLPAEQFRLTRSQAERTSDGAGDEDDGT